MREAKKKALGFDELRMIAAKSSCAPKCNYHEGERFFAANVPN
jgi:hypothetical protein